MLSDSEQRRLQEIEALLSGDDPKFVERFRRTRAGRVRRLVAVCAAVACTLVAVVGLIVTNVPVTVVAICGIGVAGGVWTWQPAPSLAEQFDTRKPPTVTGDTTL